MGQLPTQDLPRLTDLCGEPEHGSRGVRYSGNDDTGACDGKVTSEDMVLHGLQMQARWGHPDGATFEAARFLRANPTWSADNGALAVFGLQTFSAQTPNPWVTMKQPAGPRAIERAVVAPTWMQAVSRFASDLWLRLRRAIDGGT